MVDGGEESWSRLSLLVRSQSSHPPPRPQSLLCRSRLLLTDVVDQDLKEDEENDDDVVALLQERAALRPAGRSAPQRPDAPANTRGFSVDPQRGGGGASRRAGSPANVLLRLLYGFNGTLKFTEVRAFLPQTTAVFALVTWNKVCEKYMNLLPPPATLCLLVS